MKRGVFISAMLAVLLLVSGCHNKKPQPQSASVSLKTTSVGLKATALDNVVVGGQWGNQVAIRFQANSTVLAAVRVYWITENPTGKSGYASGTGGSFVYELHADNSGFPGNLISTALFTVPMPTENGHGGFPLVCFPPSMLVVGQYYDMVVRNIDPTPKVNWSSLDFLTYATTLNQTPDVQVIYAPTGNKWQSVDGGQVMGSPVAIFYSNGTVQGYGYIAAGSLYPNGLECGQAYGFPASTCQ